MGLYLGDGYVSKEARTWKLRVTLDTAYPGIIDECGAAMEAVFPGKHAHIWARTKANCVDVSTCSNAWPLLLPQHGPGRKHERQIVLEGWQERLLEGCNEEFVRGLIHSDGCRVVANDRGVRSVRYHFSNASTDILSLYCGALDALGIPWTHPSKRDIAVYRKAATRRMDEFVGPKR
ncbi:hypothetical protein [Smaragdicoccus niigatensis]|uniref:hypothetical protein n=1 Tax=Smaragdicoccus niigatensis TaxID=359359 RepID=UPI0039F0AC65